MEEKNTVWENAFIITEAALNGDNNRSNLNKVLKLVLDFTKACDIHIYKYNSSINEITNHLGIVDKDKKITEFYHNGKIIDFAVEIKIVLDNYCYIIIIDNSEKKKNINENYSNMLKRAFTVIFNNYELQNTLKSNYRIDALTGVWNRYEYMEVTDNLFKEENAYLTFAVADLFRLKYINDNFGHLYGDKYISLAAKLLTEEFHNDSMIFRLGGDEFAIISQSVSKDDMQKRLVNVNKKLNKENFNLHIPFPLLINYGVVEDVATASNIYLRADEVMFEHKTKTYKKLKIDRRR